MNKHLFALALVLTLVPLASNVSDLPPAAAQTRAFPTPTEAPRCARKRPGLGGARFGGDGRTAAREGSTVALVRWGAATVAYVADEDDDAVHTVDLDGKRVRATTRVGSRPSQLLVLADGRVAVALRGDNRLVVLEPSPSADAPLEKLCSIDVPTEPVGLALTPNDATLLVTSAWDRRLSALDTSTFAKRFDTGLPREPRAVVADDDGTRAFVAHVVGAKMSVVDLVGDHDARPVDLGVRRTSVGGIRDDRVQGGCQGFALAKSVAPEESALGEREVVSAPAPKPHRATAPAQTASTPPRLAPKTAAVAPPPARERTVLAPRGRIFAPMVTVDPGTSSVSSEYGAGRGRPAEVPMVSVVDAAAERALTTSVIGESTHREGDCLLPRAAVFVPSRGSVLVTCLGIDDLVELDARGLDPSRVERARWSVPAGPTGVAVDAARHRAVVWSQFDRALAVVDLDRRDPPTGVVQIPARPGSKMTPELQRGRKLFHATGDRRISRDGRACASCHPEGREDALTWSTPDGKRQTIMLAGRLASAEPFSWNGSNPTLEDHVQHTFKRLGGKGFEGSSDRADLRALLAYIQAMPAPRPRPAADPELVKKGRALFFDEAQGCASCHVGGTGVDRERHRVGTNLDLESAPPIDTPSLRFVSGTAPYFHDGRFQTLDELLASRDHAMGRTLQLGRTDRLALVAYMETL